MSRSKKRTPITGVTAARSEKTDKRLWHRRLRRKVRLAIGRDALVFPDPREVSNPWTMAKDGKWFFGNDRSERQLAQKRCPN
jgi:hypothetical protein